MEIKIFPALFAAIFYLLFFSGCSQLPGPFETLADFEESFSKEKHAPLLPAEKLLTLERAIKTARLNNPSLLAAAQAVQAAKFTYYRSLSAYAPEINLSSSPQHTLSRGWELKNPPPGVMKRNNHFTAYGTIQATWLIFDGFARELETIIAKEEFRKSKAASENVLRLLERAVAYAYYDMYQAGEEMVIFAEDLAFQQSALLQAQERFRNGHVSKASVLNFQILAARARSRISNARYRRQTAFHALCALMGCNEKHLTENVALEKISYKAIPFIHDDLFYLELAISNRPDLLMEKIALTVAHRSRQKVYADFMPEFRFFSEYTLDAYNAGYGGYKVSNARSRQGIFTYGVEGRWNIFKGFDSYNNLRRYKALEQIALRELNKKFLEIVAEVRDAASNCRNARYQIQLYQDMEQWVREQRDLVYSEYINGRETITRLNEAQDTLIQAQNQLIVSAVEFNKAAAQLAAATGTGR